MSCISTLSGVTSGPGGSVCRRPGSSFTLFGVRADSVEALEAGAADLVLEADVRLSMFTPGSSLKVWMVRGRLSMMVVVVVTREVEGMEAEEEGGRREARGWLISRM